MSGNWGDSEVRLLLTRRAEDEINQHITGTVKDGPLLERLSKELQQRGFARDKAQWKQWERVPEETASGTHMNTKLVEHSGNLAELTQQKDSDVPDLVPAHEANTRCPQMVISYYEERIVWRSGPEDEAQ
ncbi:chromobox protein homolog 3-like [Diretmus argenteus]